MQIHKLLSRAEAAEYLHISRSTLDRLRREGWIRATQRGKRTGVFYRPSDLDAYIKRISGYGPGGAATDA